MKKIFFLLLSLLPTLAWGQSASELKVLKSETIKPKGKLVGISADAKYLLITGDCNQELLRYSVKTGKTTTVSRADGAGYQPLISTDGSAILHRESTITPQKRRQHKQVAFLAQLELTDQELNDSTLQDSIALLRESYAATQQQQLDMLKRKMLVKGQFGGVVFHLAGQTKMLSPNGTQESYLWPSVSPNGKHLLYYIGGKGAFVCNLQGGDVRFLGHNVRGAQWLNDNIVIGMNDQNNVPNSRSNLVTVEISATKVNRRNFQSGLDVMFPFVAGNTIACCTRGGEIYMLRTNLANTIRTLSIEDAQQRDAEIFANVASIPQDEMNRIGIVGSQANNSQLKMQGLRIYLNPGHGSWGKKDRPKATIPYPKLSSTAVPDTLGFFESNTNLWNSLYLGQLLERRGAKVYHSRKASGPWPYKKVNGQYPGFGDFEHYTELQDYAAYNRPMNELTEEVEANDFDLFLSIHSNSADEASTVNFPLYIYRGKNAPKDKRQQISHDMGVAMWKYTWQFFDGLEHASNYSLSNTNVKGDLDFYKAGSGGKTIGNEGYLAVMKHGAPGGLWEGFFHTYQPCRHRALNPDYNKLEAVCYYRGLLEYLGEPADEYGTLCGTVKDDSLVVTNSQFKYAKGTHDQWMPCNGAKVTLTDHNGHVVSTYQVDNNWNGLFVFFDLKPGTYTLRAECNGYVETLMSDIRVKANAITCKNLRMKRPQPEPEPEEEAEFEPPVLEG